MFGLRNPSQVSYSTRLNGCEEIKDEYVPKMQNRKMFMLSHQKELDFTAVYGKIQNNARPGIMLILARHIALSVS